MGKTVEVVAAALVSGGRVLATQRGYGEWKGWWEFPGGKVEAGESHEEALRRELREELALEAEVRGLVGTVDYDYPEFHLSMRLYHCTSRGVPSLLEHSDARWLSAAGLDDVDWLPADVQVLGRLKILLERQ